MEVFFKLSIVANVKMKLCNYKTTAPSSHLLVDMGNCRYSEISGVKNHSKKFLIFF